MKFSLSILALPTIIGVVVFGLVICGNRYLPGSSLFTVASQSNEMRADKRSDVWVCNGESAMKVLNDKAVRNTDPELLMKGLRCLGEVKRLGGDIGDNAITRLIELLDFQDRAVSNDEPTLAPVHPRGFGHDYPAIEILSIIGKKSLPLLIESIATNPHKSTVSENAVTAVIIIVRDSPIEGINLLEVSKNNYDEPERRNRIDSAIKRVKNFYKL